MNLQGVKKFIDKYFIKNLSMNRYFEEYLDFDLVGGKINISYFYY